MGLWGRWEGGGEGGREGGRMTHLEGRLRWWGGSNSRGKPPDGNCREDEEEKGGGVRERGRGREEGKGKGERKRRRRGGKKMHG